MNINILDNRIGNHIFTERFEAIHFRKIVDDISNSGVRRK